VTAMFKEKSNKTRKPYSTLQAGVDYDVIYERGFCMQT
jgi:hypothetical protein